MFEELPHGAVGDGAIRASARRFRTTMRWMVGQPLLILRMMLDRRSPDRLY